MFNFYNMAGTYEDRKVDRYEEGKTTISTASVTDGQHPYETAVAHPRYDDGDWIVVEAYDSKEDAQEGHNKWVKTMTADELPDELRDCYNAGVAKLGQDLFGDDFIVAKQTEESDDN